MKRRADILAEFASGNGVKSHEVNVNAQIKCLQSTDIAIVFTSLLI